MAGVLAGHLVYAGAINQAVMEWARAGGGATGWVQARRVLRDRFPDARPASIDAVMRAAESQWAVGRRYGKGGPDFRPHLSELPDLRPALRNAGIRPGGELQGAAARRVFHQVEITIRDPNDPKRIVQITSHVVSANDVLSRGVLEAEGNRIARQYLNNFREYDPQRMGQYGFSANIRLVGAYIGY